MSAGRRDLPGSLRGTSGLGEKQSQACIQLAELWFKSVLPWFDWKENICLERSWLIAVNYWPGEQTTDGQPKLDFLQLLEGRTSPKTSAALKDTRRLCLGQGPTGCVLQNCAGQENDSYFTSLEKLCKCH